MPSAEPDAHTPRDILKMLNTAAGGQGNLLLNIGPAPDGSIPPEAMAPLKTVGKWLARNGDAVYGRVGRAPVRATACGALSQKGATVYFWCRCWPGREMGLGGFKTRLKSACFLATGKKIDFEQSGHRIVLKGLPAKSPDKLAGVTVIELTFASRPRHVRCADSPAMHV